MNRIVTSIGDNGAKRHTQGEEDLRCCIEPDQRVKQPLPLLMEEYISVSRTPDTALIDSCQLGTRHREQRRAGIDMFINVNQSVF